MIRGAGSQHDDNVALMQLPFCSDFIACCNLILPNLVVFSFSNARELIIWSISIFF